MSVTDEFIDWAHEGLFQSEEAQSYLTGRGVSEDQWRRHRIGYVIGDFHPDSSKDPDHDPSGCLKQGGACDSCRLVKWSSSYEERQQIIGARIVGFIVLPLTSYSGASVGFQVRSIREKVFDSFTIKRRPEGYFFGIAPNMEHIWSTREVSLVEGPFDQLIFERLVARNVLALTTSVIGRLQSRFLQRFTSNVNMCLDADAPGRDGTRKAAQRLEGVNVRDIRCPVVRDGDKDPSDFWKAVGDKKFSEVFKRKMRELI